MPDLIHWSDDYSIGVQAIDEQHKILIEIINTLHNAMREGRGMEVIVHTYDELLNYTIYHFGLEKNLMNSNGLFGAELRQHREEHRRFMQTSIDLQNKLHSGHQSLTIPTLFFLSDWLSNHILKTDRELGRFLNSKGVR